MTTEHQTAIEAVKSRYQCDDTLAAEILRNLAIRLRLHPDRVAELMASGRLPDLKHRPRTRQ